MPTRFPTATGYPRATKYPLATEAPSYAQIPPDDAIAALPGATIRTAFEAGIGATLVTGSLHALTNLATPGTGDFAAGIADGPYSATGGPNGFAKFGTTGAAFTPTSYQQSSCTISAPGTTPIFVYYIARIVTDIANGYVFVHGAAGARLQSTGANGAFIYNGVAVSGTLTMTAGTWYRIWALFTNSTSDTLAIGASSTTGTNTGNFGPFTDFTAGGSSSGTNGITLAEHTAGLVANVPNTALVSSYVTKLDQRYRSLFGTTVAF